MMILIVDDEAGMRWILSRILSQKGFQVQAAQTATEALEIIEREPISAAIINYRLTEINGLELFKQIRQQGQLIPSMLITAYGSKELEQAALQSGFQAYIEKPFDNQRLIDQLHQALCSP